ncbi:hypothetical protein AAE478_001312 [Parahypoxylon ruwenzoriense]
MGLSKVDIIAAPTRDPRAAAQQSSSVTTLFAPTLVAALRCHQVLVTASLFLYIRTHWIMCRMILASQIFAGQAYVALTFFRFQATVLGKIIWNTKTIARLRKKIMFEFFTLILGSGGNTLFLVLFWPGWWVLGLIAFIAQLCVAC